MLLAGNLIQGERPLVSRESKKRRTAARKYIPIRLRSYGMG